MKYLEISFYNCKLYDKSFFCVNLVSRAAIKTIVKFFVLMQKNIILQRDGAVKIFDLI